MNNDDGVMKLNLVELVRPSVDEVRPSAPISWLPFSPSESERLGASKPTETSNQSWKPSVRCMHQSHTAMCSVVITCILGVTFHSCLYKCCFSPALQILIAGAILLGLCTIVSSVGGPGVSATSLENFKDNAIEGSAEFPEKVSAN